MDEAGNETASSSSKLPVNVECSMELRDDGDEDEDVDFNPCLKEILSPDASSSLSSEIEERDLVGDLTDSSIGYLHNGDDEAAPQDFGITGEQASNFEENLASVCQSEIECIRDHETGLTSGADFADYSAVEQLGTKEDNKNPVSISDFDDDEDAICKRTRARYSLASFTLDELETFLQETDDDDDLPNVDDEEEYRKFLAAVLLGGDGDGKNDHESQAVDDEDEENDADFELEIEEALESDVDDRINREGKDEGWRRPETRQNKHKKASSVKDSGNLQNVQRPLRPLVPIMPNAPLLLLSAMEKAPIQPCLSPSLENGVANGFTPHQLGQLHCIIYEHIQLLVQVFSLSICDPARQHIASQVEGLIMDLIGKKNQALAQRSEPHPYSFFSPPYLQPSVQCELSKTWPIQFSSVQPQPPSQDSFGHVIPSHPNTVPPANERFHSEGQEDNLHKEERVFWLPVISGPLISILDATPLRSVGDYVHDVKKAMRDYQQRYLRDTCDTQFERESMFPSFLNPTVCHADPTTSKVSSSDGVSSLPSRQSSRKSFVAELIENSKKQPIALVPRVVSNLAQRFYAMFNPALYPRKPPPVVIANRVLFTSTEDELLALGMMEYNTDWKAIQQRFLPCKSKHQIFVRQKNCCSSKAPDNPIKAVRRMKTSPLTVDEVGRIREGLRIFKLDWFSIWKYIVPYRDPSLLARQWRIALGTQKSYKTDSVNRERRRQYEANRRRAKAEMAESQTLSQKRDNHNSADDSIENEDRAFFHEAFLADWRPGTSSLVSSQPKYLGVRDKNISVCSDVQAYQLNQSGAKLPVNSEVNVENGPDTEKGSYNSNSSKAIFCSRPIRARRSRKTQMVKLAPELPALNLPPSVRVISQSAFKSYHSVASVKVPANGTGGAQYPIPSRLSFPGAAASLSNMHMPNQRGLAQTSVTNSRDDNDGTDLEMHPLLFRSSGNESGLQYHLLKSSSSNSCSFSFFNGCQPQASGSLFNKEQDATVCSLYSSLKSPETTSAPCNIDFHPLLRRADGAECSSTRNALLHVRPSITTEHEKQMAKGNPSSSCNKANETNMEIQLSSSSKDQQFGMMKDGAGNKRPDVENIITSKGTRNLPTSPTGNDLTPPFFLDSSTNACTCRLNLADEQSLDIIMEQEELSDSDEEDNVIEEDVEFECEEMTDSEPDAGSDFDAAVQAQSKAAVRSPNKEVPNSDRNKSTVAEPSSKTQTVRDGSHFHPYLPINWAGQDKDSQKCNEDKIRGNSSPCQPSRPSKKRTSIRKRSRAAAVTPLPEPLNLSTSIEVHPKKPRKRIARSKLNLNAATAAAGCADTVNTNKQL